MEEKDAYLWWDVMHDIVQKDIRKVYRMYEKNEKFYRHKISQMEKVILLFQYQLLVLTPKLETSNEEKKKEQIDGAKPTEIKTTKQEPIDLKGGRDNSRKET